VEKKTEDAEFAIGRLAQAEEWQDFNCPEPDPNKLEKILVEIVDSFSELIHGAAFNFLLTEGQSTQFNFPFDKQDPKPPAGNEFSDWKMRWYSTLDPWFLMLLQRRAGKFDLLKSDSRTDAKTVHAFNTVRKTSNDLVFCVEQLSFYLGTFMGETRGGKPRSDTRHGEESKTNSHTKRDSRVEPSTGSAQEVRSY
jgi:hypothetical protein